MRIDSEFAEVVGRTAWHVYLHQRSGLDFPFWADLIERTGWNDDVDWDTEDGDPTGGCCPDKPDQPEEFQRFGRLVINQLAAAKVGYAPFAAVSVEAIQLELGDSPHGQRFTRIIKPLQYMRLPENLRRVVDPPIGTPSCRR